MSIKKKGNYYLLDFYPSGISGKRVRKKFKTKQLAKIGEAEILLLFKKAPELYEKDERKLSDLINLWHKLHGQTLKDHKIRYSRLIYISEKIGNPFVYKLNVSDYADYRVRSLKEGKSKSTLNTELSFLKAVFSELSRLGYFNGVNPFSKIKAFNVPPSSLSFFTLDQMKLLLKFCKKSRNDHLYPVVLLCLATGARFGEVTSLERQYLLKDRVIFHDAKSGKSRTVRIKPSLSRFLRLKSYPKHNNIMFSSCYSAFSGAVKNAGLSLPKGRMTHILRHSFASHFIMNGGSLKVLQEVLGHSDIKTTMIYAHLAPEYLETVLTIGIYPDLRG